MAYRPISDYITRAPEGSGDADTWRTTPTLPFLDPRMSWPTDPYTGMTVRRFRPFTTVGGTDSYARGRPWGPGAWDVVPPPPPGPPPDPGNYIPRPIDVPPPPPTPRPGSGEDEGPGRLPEGPGTIYDRGGRITDRPLFGPEAFNPAFRDVAGGRLAGPLGRINEGLMRLLDRIFPGYTARVTRALQAQQAADRAQRESLERALLSLRESGVAPGVRDLLERGETWGGWTAGQFSAEIDRARQEAFDRTMREMGLGPDSPPFGAPTDSPSAPPDDTSPQAPPADQDRTWDMFMPI